MYAVANLSFGGVVEVFCANFDCLKSIGTMTPETLRQAMMATKDRGGYCVQIAG